MPTFIWIVLLFFVAIPIGQAIARLISSKAERPSIPEGSAGQLRELERQVRYLTEQVAGLQEHQEFLTHLLEGRPSNETSAQTEEERR
jgi:hypothetical protein